MTKEAHTQVFKVTARSLSECKDQLIPAIEAWRKHHPECEIEDVEQRVMMYNGKTTLVLTTEYYE